MLCSCPPRAQRPIVPGVNFTLDDASKSAASDREIQSEGAFDIGQSGSFEELPDELPEVPLPLDVWEPPLPPVESPGLDEWSPEPEEESRGPADESPDPEEPESAGDLAPSSDSGLDPRDDELPDRLDDRSLRAQPVPL